MQPLIYIFAFTKKHIRGENNSIFLLFSQLFFEQQYSISFAKGAALIDIYNDTYKNEWSPNWDFGNR